MGDAFFQAQLFACFGAAIFCGILPPAFGFGCALMFNSLWYIFDDLNLLDVDDSSEALLATITLLNIIVHSGTVYQRRSEVNLHLAGVLFLLQIPGVLIGVLLNEEFGDEIWFKRSMGIVFLICLGGMLLKEYYRDQTQEEMDFNDVWKSAETGRVTAAVCFLSGLLSGIAGLGGPPFIILALFYTVSRETFIGTYLCARTLVSFTVLITIAITDDTLTSDVVPSIGTTMLGGFCGVTLGQELSKHVKPKVFIKVLQIILLLSSVLISLDDTGVEFIAAGATFGLLLLYSAYKWWRLKQELEFGPLKETQVKPYGEDVINSGAESVGRNFEVKKRDSKPRGSTSSDKKSPISPNHVDLIFD